MYSASSVPEAGKCGVVYVVRVSGQPRDTRPARVASLALSLDVYYV